MASERFMRHNYGASGYVEKGEPNRSACPEKPEYRKVLCSTANTTPLFFIVCDEGWRESTVCSGMYEWAADWLIEQIQGKPYAKPSEKPAA